MTHKEFSQRGGQASVKKRFDGKTKEQISEEMRLVRYNKRYSPESQKILAEMGKAALESFRTAKHD